MSEPVRLGDVIVNEPVRTGWGPPQGPAPEGGALDQLTDVTGTAAADPGTVLVKGVDGIWRAQPVPPAPPAWGEPVRYRHGEPEDGGPEGAVHVDLATGRLWRYTNQGG